MWKYQTGFRKSGLRGGVVPGLGFILHENINVYRKNGLRGGVVPGPGFILHENIFRRSGLRGMAVPGLRFILLENIKYFQKVVLRERWSVVHLQLKYKCFQQKWS